MGLYNWSSKCLLWLPLRAADHDPVNTLSVNRGRAGSTLDAVFGAGAATPTKLGHRRGYDFGGNDNMQPSAGGYALTTGLVSVMLTLTGPPTGIADCPFSWETVGGDRVVFFLSSATNMQFYSGGGAAGNQATAPMTNYAMGPTQPYTLVGLYDGTNTRLFINGEWVDDAATPVAPAATAQPMWIGTRTNGANDWTGEIYHVGMADFALSPAQCAQYHREQMKRINKI